MNADAGSRGRVAVLAEEGYQEMELWVPYYRLQEEGYAPLIVGPRNTTYKSKLGYPAAAVSVDEAGDPRSLAGVVIPGGWAPDRMRLHDGLLKLVQTVFENNRPVAAICHAGWVLASAGVARGRRLTCYAAIRDDMVNAGAEYVDEEVVVDGNLITARKPADIPAFCAALVRGLREQS